MNRFNDYCYEEGSEEYWREYEEYVISQDRLRYEQYCLSPEQEEKFAKQLTGEIPIENGNRMSLVINLYMSDFHVSEQFPEKYPEAWKIYSAYCDMI